MNAYDFIAKNWSVEECEEFIQGYNRESAIANGEVEEYDAAYSIALENHRKVCGPKRK